MYQLARDTYGILQSQLGDKQYMFGDRYNHTDHKSIQYLFDFCSPTTLDCIVFGYLALHLYPDLAHRRLQHILKNEYPKLASYCDRINNLLFKDNAIESAPVENMPSLWRTFVNNPSGFFSSVKDDVVSYMGSTTDDEHKPEKSSAQVDFERKRIWSIAGGVTFFLAYVIYNGILSIEINDERTYDDDEEYEYEYEDEDEE